MPPRGAVLGDAVLAQQPVSWTYVSNLLRGEESTKAS